MKRNIGIFIGVLSCFLWFSSMSYAVCPTEGWDPDLNDDTVVNILDVSIVGSCWGQDPAVCDTRADTDGDGDVDMDDINCVVAHWGETGFPPEEEEEDNTAPEVTIISPENLVTVGSSPVTVTGTVDDTDAILTVNGFEVPINPDGTYSVDGIVLNEGGNTIVATAIDAASNVGTANIHVYFDSTAPYVTITYPEDGYTTTSDTITVTGSIVDIVKGEVNEENASVSVNGIPAAVSNKTFTVEDLLLVEGENVITAVGADQTGNTATDTVTVTLDLSALKTVNMVSGNNQAGAINTTLTDPLVVSLTNDGAPVPDKTVIFKVTQNNGTMTGDSGEGTYLAETTDENGKAQANFALGSTAGVGNNKVEVSAVGFTGEAVFTASGLIGVPHKINIATGNDQKGAVSIPLPKPLIAIVTDEGHNPVKNAPVTFSVAQGGGNFGGLPSTTVNTDSDGRATVNFTLGPEEGSSNNAVEANFPGNTGAAAIFRASGLTVGDPGDTRISGVVLDNTNTPIPGVTMRVEGTTREDVTDGNGQFLIENVPVGPLHLIADGSTATVPGEYPMLAFEIDTVAGQNNTLPMPIYLLPLNITNTQFVGGGEDVVYTLDSIPGFSLTIMANSVTFPDGSHEGNISVTQVHADKVPMSPPNGFQPRFIITIQPPGAVFDPPAPITLPNVDGLAPNEITEMYSFDHDLGQFVSIGTGTVSEDGQVIASDPGVGVIKAGWHCGGNPQGAGCTHNCPECAKCKDPPCMCEPDPAKEDTCCDTEKICKGGHCVSVTLTSVEAKVNGKDEDFVVFQAGGTSVNFTGTASGSNCEYEYNWTFGDGNTSTSQNPSHTYANSGEYDVELKVKCKKCSPPEKTDTVKVMIYKVEIKTLEFTSDHNVICDGTTVTAAGARFPNIEWDPDAAPSVNAPITHTASSTDKIALTLILEVKGIPNNTSYTLTGSSAESALQSSKAGTISSGANVSIPVVATNVIGDTIRKIEKKITWSMEVNMPAPIGNTTINLGDTGNHVIYTTIGSPDTSAPSSSSVPNVPRMDISVPTVKNAITAASTSSNYTKIIWEIVKAEGGYNLELQLNDNEAWTLPSTPSGADCLSISKFVRNICMSVGMPGGFAAETYAAYYRVAADLHRPKKAIAGLELNNPFVNSGDQGAPATAGLNASWILGLADSNCIGGGGGPGTVGCGPDGLNAFEAAVIYTDQASKKWYFPGGTDFIYDNIDAIVQIFETMAWVGPGDHDGNPLTPDVFEKVEAVDYTYTLQPDATP